MNEWIRGKIVVFLSAAFLPRKHMQIWIEFLFNSQDVSTLSFRQTYTFFNEANFILGTNTKMKYDFSMFTVDKSESILTLICR